MLRNDRNNRPPSVSDGLGITLGLASLIVTLVVSRSAGLSTPAALISAIASWSIPVAIYDLVVLRVHLRPSTGLDWSLRRTRPPNRQRTAIKLIGMFATLAALAAAYSFLPSAVRSHYQLFLGSALIALPLLTTLGAVYIAMVDRVMVQPSDSLFEIGSLVAFRFRERNWASIRDHALSWTIKGFFLPQMFGFLVGGIWRFLSEPIDFSLSGCVAWLAALAILLELVIVVTGYSLTVRLLDAHIRSPNTFWLAWVACLVCYFPFNAMTLRHIFRYKDGMQWDDWLGENLWLAAPWGVMLVCCYATWVWATAIYGVRWSNLTNRGIVTNGPYRFTKHPDYISKSAFWWLSSVPFVSAEGWRIALFHSVMLTGLNLVYWARAKTEERHLMRDPAYAAYAAWIAEHGAIARLRRVYRPLIASGAA